MIIDLPATTTSALNRKLIDIRERGGTVTLTRVLTLVIVTDESHAEEAIEAANGASFEHPCRVIVLAHGGKRGSARLDGQIRVGGDAGASEVLVLRLFGELTEHGASVVVPLLLPDAPVVAWWPGPSPAEPSADPVGRMAQRRILDAAAATRPHAALLSRVDSFAPGDTDLSWTRITLWRGLLASMLDQPPFEKVESVIVEGAADSPSTDLMAGWLALRLKVPVTRRNASGFDGLQSVTFQRESGPLSLRRAKDLTAVLAAPGQPDRQIALPRRNLRDCLAEELRRLDDDIIYHEVLSKGLSLVDSSARRRSSASKATSTAGAKEGTEADDAPLEPAEKTRTGTTRRTTTVAKSARS